MWCWNWKQVGLFMWCWNWKQVGLFMWCWNWEWLVPSIGAGGGGGDKCEDLICVMRMPFMTHPQPVLYHDLSCWLPVFQSFDFSLSDICFLPYPLQSCFASFSKLLDSDVCLACVCIQSVTTVFTFCWMTLTSLTVTWAPCDVSWLMCLWVWQPSTVWPSITTLWRSSGSVCTRCLCHLLCCVVQDSNRGQVLCTLCVICCAV